MNTTTPPADLSTNDAASDTTRAYTTWHADDAEAFEAALMHPALAEGPLPEMVEGFITGSVISPFDGLADTLMGALLALFEIDLTTLDEAVREPLLAITQKRMDAILDGLDQDIAQEVAAQDGNAPASEYSVYAPLLADWQQARQALQDNPEDAAEQPPEAIDLPRTAELWARGMQLARLVWQEDDWDRLDKATRKEVARLYAPIDRLCATGKDEVTGERQRLKLFDDCTDAVYALHDITQQFYDRLAVAHAPIVKAPTPGRNDPCSCGSGKKYKKCCGA